MRDAFDDDDEDAFGREGAEHVDRILAKYEHTEKNLKRALLEQATFIELSILERVEDLLKLPDSQLAEDARAVANLFIRRAGRQ